MAKLAWNWRRFVPTRWAGIPQGPERVAAQEAAEKIAELARAIDVLPSMDRNCVIPWLGATCPPGWELVAELEGKVMLGTTEDAQDVGSTGGAMSHTHTIDHGHTASSNSTGAHTHDVTVSGETGDALNAADAAWTVGADGTYTTTSNGAHSHTITVNNHAGNSGSGDHTPSHVKVLFCRRKL